MIILTVYAVLIHFVIMIILIYIITWLKLRLHTVFHFKRFGLIDMCRFIPTFCSLRWSHKYLFRKILGKLAAKYGSQCVFCLEFLFFITELRSGVVMKS